MATCKKPSCIYVNSATFSSFLAGLFGEGALAGAAAFLGSAGTAIFGQLAPLLSFWPAAAIGGVFAIGGYLLAATASATQEQLVLEGRRAVLASADISYRTTSTILEWYRNRQKNKLERDAIYDRAISKARGVPVMSSLVFARVSMRRLTEKKRKEERDDRSLLALNVLYDTDSKQRFQFVEYYGLQDVPSKAELADFARVYSDSNWDTVPDTTEVCCCCRHPTWSRRCLRQRCCAKCRWTRRSRPCSRPRCCVHTTHSR